MCLVAPYLSLMDLHSAFLGLDLSFKAAKILGVINFGSL